ncbi:unnamed protein product [Camellia sinensis]
MSCVRPPQLALPSRFMSDPCGIAAAFDLDWLAPTMNIAHSTRRCLASFAPTAHAATPDTIDTATQSATSSRYHQPSLSLSSPLSTLVVTHGVLPLCYDTPIFVVGLGFGSFGFLLLGSLPHHCSRSVRKYLKPSFLNSTSLLRNNS